MIEAQRTNHPSKKEAEIEAVPTEPLKESRVVLKKQLGQVDLTNLDTQPKKITVKLPTEDSGRVKEREALWNYIANLNK